MKRVSAGNNGAGKRAQGRVAEPHPGTPPRRTSPASRPSAAPFVPGPGVPTPPAGTWPVTAAPSFLALRCHWRLPTPTPSPSTPRILARLTELRTLGFRGRQRQGQVWLASLPCLEHCVLHPERNARGFRGAWPLLIKETLPEPAAEGGPPVSQWGTWILWDLH